MRKEELLWLEYQEFCYGKCDEKYGNWSWGGKLWQGWGNESYHGTCNYMKIHLNKSANYISWRYIFSNNSSDGLTPLICKIDLFVCISFIKTSEEQEQMLYANVINTVTIIDAP